jgi:polyisoprenoid-binding protein YceI
MTNGIAQIPGFIAGTWQLDPNHSDVGFVVGHLVMSKVHGRFDAFSGTVVTDEDLDRSSVSVSIDAASVDTHLAVRDNQVRSADFLDAEHFPNITFESTAVRDEAGRYFVDGDLTIRGTTRPVTLDLTVQAPVVVFVWVGHCLAPVMSVISMRNPYKDVGPLSRAGRQRAAAPRASGARAGSGI